MKPRISSRTERGGGMGSNIIHERLKALEQRWLGIVLRDKSSGNAKRWEDGELLSCRCAELAALIREFEAEQEQEKP